jgi:hypothetical protein
MRSTASFDTRIYQAALYLYPPSFRREFSPEMVRDFDEARHDPDLVGRARGLWKFRVHMMADLARAVMLQWLRTGWPVIAVVSVICPVAAVSALANVWPRELFAVPDGIARHDADLLALQVLATILLLVIAATIMVTQVLMRSLARRRRH